MTRTLVASVRASALSLAALSMAAAAVGAFAQGAARPAGPQEIFRSALPDVAGKELVVVELTLPPRGERPSAAHRHPGSVFVYVTEGVARLAIDGQPVREVKAGESFFEPPGALHTIAESADPAKPAKAIAVMLVPDGAPLVTPAN